MKKMNNKVYEESEGKSFEIFKNAMSVGWHLRKIQEADPTFLDDKKDYQRFVVWLERHKIKK